MTAPGHDHDRWADAVGAYLLDALPAGEREGFEAHLADCPGCRRDVEDLRVAADALPVSVDLVEPPAVLRDRIMSVVRAEAELLAAAGERADRPEIAATGRDGERASARRPSAGRRRTVGDRGRRSGGRFPGGWTLRPGVAVACALALLVLGGAGGALLRGGGAEVHSITATVDTARAPGAKVRLDVGDGESMLVAERFPPPPAGRVYQVWIKRPGRSPEPTSVLWSVRRDGSAEVAVPGSLEGVEAVLVTDEPIGGSAAPTRQPVISVQPA